MRPDQIAEYFEALLARLSKSVQVRWVETLGCLPHACHDNVGVFIANNPDYRPVPGWLVTPTPGIHMFHAHSVVEQPNGRLIDITPGQDDRAGLLFLEHLGSPADYNFLKVQCAQWFHPILPDLLSGWPTPCRIDEYPPLP